MKATPAAVIIAEIAAAITDQSDWVGKAVERASGQLLGNYLAEHLFEPIGMKDTE